MGGAFESPRLPYTVEGRGSAFVLLQVRQRGCGTGVLPGEASIRYRVRGTTRVLDLPVAIAVKRCVN